MSLVKRYHAIYYASGIANNHELHQFTMLAYNKTHALKKLLMQQITPLEIKKSFTFKRKIKHTLILNFLEQLRFLLQASIPLSQAFELLIENENNPLMKQILIELTLGMKQGQSFSTMLQQFPDYFSKFVISYIKNGEHTGDLTTTLEKICSLLNYQLNTKNALKKKLSYPFFLFISTLVTTIGMLLFILPQYQHFFHEMGGDLPPLTQALLNFSAWLKHQGGKYSLISLSTLSFIRFTFYHNSLKFTWHKISLKIPFVNSLVLAHNLSRWCYLLAHSLKSGLSLLHAIQLANQSMDNLYLQKKLQALNAALKSGESLHKSLTDTHLFHLIPLNMVQMSETTGTMGLVFSKIAEGYQAQLNKYLSALIRGAEPTCLIFLAALVGLLFAALYLPMLNLGLPT